MISITVETMGYYENLNVTSCLKSVRDRVELALGWVGEITFKFRLRGLEGRVPQAKEIAWWMSLTGIFSCMRDMKTVCEMTAENSISIKSDRKYLSLGGTNGGFSSKAILINLIYHDKFTIQYER